MSREGARLLNLLGFKGVKGVSANIGLEQEFFFVPRDAYLKRVDLQMSGRTVMGKMPPRNQEVRDYPAATCPCVLVQLNLTSLLPLLPRIHPLYLT